MQELPPAITDETERLSLLKQTIAKNERGEWVLVPARIADYLLNAGSPLEIRTFKDNKDIITYNKVADSGVWNPNGTKEIEQAVSDIVDVCGKKLKEQLTRFVMSEVLAQIQWKTYMDRDNFRAPAGKIPLLNGVLDFAAGKLEPHRQENNFLYQVPVKYEATATCPEIDKFLEEILGERKPLAYEMAGYMLCANAESLPNKWQRAFMLIGPGDNGKSTYLNLVTALLGDENVSNQTLQALVENRFSVATLDHKLANIAADIGDRSLYATAQFKNLTGGDKITAEHKFKDAYEFRNPAILAFSCNILPESYDDSNAYHKRWVIAPFENTFTDKKDPKLLEKLSTAEELSGFLNQAIAAYREMDTRGTFTSEGATIEQKRDFYTKLSDPVSCFVEDCILFDPEGMVNKQQLYTEFRTYAQKRGYGKTFTQKRFFKKFREKAGEQLYESYVKDGDGVQRRIFKGIKLETASQTTLQEAAPA
jgi:putative DNA primase/helicase